MLKNTKKINHGFTLVEMLVSIGLFAVVSTMSIGTLLVLIEANGRAQAMQLVMTNLSFSIDAMTREIRTGSNWYCFPNSANNPPKIPGTSIRDCSGGSGNFIAVVEAGTVTSDGDPGNIDSRRITYWLDPDQYGTGHGAIVRRTREWAAGHRIIPVTGRDVMIDDFSVTLTGSADLASGDTVQPTANIYIRGRSGAIANGATDNTQTFELQTTVVQRLLDI